MTPLPSAVQHCVTTNLKFELRKGFTVQVSKREKWAYNQHDFELQFNLAKTISSNDQANKSCGNDNCKILCLIWAKQKTSRCRADKKCRRFAEDSQFFQPSVWFRPSVWDTLSRIHFLITSEICYTFTHQNVLTNARLFEIPTAVPSSPTKYKNIQRPIKMREVELKVVHSGEQPFSFDVRVLFTCLFAARAVDDLFLQKQNCRNRC